MGETNVKKKKKSTALPRVTVLAYNRRDLVAFVGAVEQLRLLVADLQLVANGINRKKPKLPAVTAIPPKEGTP